MVGSLSLGMEARLHHLGDAPAVRLTNKIWFRPSLVFSSLSSGLSCACVCTLIINGVCSARDVARRTLPGAGRGWMRREGERENRVRRAECGPTKCGVLVLKVARTWELTRFPYFGDQ